MTDRTGVHSAYRDRMHRAIERRRSWKGELERLCGLLAGYDGSPEGEDNLRADIAICRKTIRDLDAEIVRLGREEAP